MAALVSLSVGCNGDDEDDLPPPTVQVSISPDTIASGDMITVDVEVEHFTLSDGQDHDHDHEDLQLDRTPGLRAGVAPQAHGDGAYHGPREGHYHVYLDDLESNPLVHTSEHRVTLAVEADPGQHEIIVRLHSLDHRIIEPQITDSTPLTVQ